MVESGGYLGALPAQSRHVMTVRPPMQEMWWGSRWKLERFMEVIVVVGVDGVIGEAERLHKVGVVVLESNVARYAS